MERYGSAGWEGVCELLGMDRRARHLQLAGLDSKIRLGQRRGLRVLLGGAAFGKDRLGLWRGRGRAFQKWGYTGTFGEPFSSIDHRLGAPPCCGESVVTWCFVTKPQLLL